MNKLNIILVKYILTFSLSPVPSAAPTDVSVSMVSFSSITVQWREVDCIHRNGEITHYQICYTILGDDSSKRCLQSEAVANTKILYITSAPQTYSIQVAAVNSAGEGSFSNPVTVKVDGKTISICSVCKGSIYISYKYILSIFELYSTTFTFELYYYIMVQ